MRKFYTITFSILCSVLVNAQVGFNNDTRVRQTMHELFAIKANIKTSLSAIPINNHYVEKPYVLGAIYYKGKKMSQNYHLRYNAFKDIIEISKDGESDTVLENTRISCTIDDSKYIYSKIQNGNTIDTGYLKLLYTGENSALYKREVILYKEAMKAKTTITPNIPARYVKFTYFYTIDKGSDIAIEIPSTKKSFITNFKKENQKNIEAFIKKEKINLNKNTDIIKVYKYYETLG